MNKEIDAHISQDDILLEMMRKLPELRKAFNFSQTQLGKLVGKSRQQISKIERGITPLSWDTCLAIVMVLIHNNFNYFVSLMGNEFINGINQFINSSEPDMSAS